MDINVEKVVEAAEAAQAANEYPSYPSKPVKLDGEKNAAFGARVDEYNDVLKPAYRAALAAYRERSGEINDKFRTGLLEALGIAKHPKANALYAIAYDHGHSEGYREVAIWADDLAELLR